MLPTGFYQTAYEYFNICCRTFSEEDFNKILTKNVQLEHQTNDKLTIQAKGREAVKKLFNFLFNHSSEVDVKSLTLESYGQGIRLKLHIQKKKHSDSEFDSYDFKETTIFQFKEKSDKNWKISNIVTEVIKHSISKSEK